MYFSFNILRLCYSYIYPLDISFQIINLLSPQTAIQPALVRAPTPRTSRTSSGNRRLQGDSACAQSDHRPSDASCKCGWSRSEPSRCASICKKGRRSRRRRRSLSVPSRGPNLCRWWVVYWLCRYRLGNNNFKRWPWLQQSPCGETWILNRLYFLALIIFVQIMIEDVMQRHELILFTETCRLFIDITYLWTENGDWQRVGGSASDAPVKQDPARTKRHQGVRAIGCLIFHLFFILCSVIRAKVLSYDMFSKCFRF